MLKPTMVGPIGVNVEYLMTPGFGLGFEVYYSSFAFSSAAQNGGNFFYRGMVSNIRIIPKFCWHYTGNSENQNLDLYGNAGIGYRSQNVVFDTNDPFFIQQELFNRTIIPLSFRFVPIGMRLYFDEHFGVTTELGFGGALLNMGATVRF